jgi:hypothetical protein
LTKKLRAGLRETKLDKGTQSQINRHRVRFKEHMIGLRNPDLLKDTALYRNTELAQGTKDWIKGSELGSGTHR